MSNALAIAAVTAVLKDLLNNGLIDHDVSGSLGGNVSVTTEAPDRIQKVGAADEPSQLNLFMYQVTPNVGWRNVGLPSRNGIGERIDNPPLGLDLHYLLTAYGAPEFHAEILLGYAMQLLHETPVLSRDAIRKALGTSPPVTGSVLPPAQQALVAAELAEQVEQIKLTPQVMSTEEMSKLWTAMQAHYRPSAALEFKNQLLVLAAYQASVVLIESRRSTKTALPVRQRNVKVFTFRQPVIERMVSQAGDDEWIVDSSMLIIRGYQLRGDVTAVRIGETEIAPASNDVTDTQIRLPVPSGLRAGVQSVQVIHKFHLGTTSPSEPHRGFESNVAAFVLHPTIDRPAPTPPSTTPTEVPLPSVTTPTPTVVDGVTLYSATVTVNFTPRVGKKQRVTLLVNEVNPPASRPAHAYSFNAPRDNGITAPNQMDTASIEFPISYVAPGVYVVRVQVDGAESPLDVNTSGQYATPKITI